MADPDADYPTPAHAAADSTDGPVSCTLVELAEKGQLRRGRRWRSMFDAVRFGLRQAKAVRSRQLAFFGWTVFSAAIGAWVLAIMRRRIGAGPWAAAVAVESAWFAISVFIGYIHLDLVRRPDGRPWRSFLIPNGMTLSRLALAPLVGFASAHALALRPEADLVLWPLVYVVGSDLLDGQIARFFKLKSEWGRLADPFSDIFLASWFAPGLWWGGLLAPWLGFLIVFRYAGTLLAVFTIWARGKPIRIVPTWPGRAANFSVDVYLPFLLAAAIRWPHWFGTWWLDWMFGLTAAAVLVNIVYFTFRLARTVASRASKPPAPAGS
jgi:phosphatidylglycerophosphate synthase